MMVVSCFIGNLDRKVELIFSAVPKSLGRTEFIRFVRECSFLDHYAAGQWDRPIWPISYVGDEQHFIWFVDEGSWNLWEDLGIGVGD